MLEGCFECCAGASKRCGARTRRGASGSHSSSEAIDAFAFLSLSLPTVHCTHTRGSTQGHAPARPLAQARPPPLRPRPRRRLPPPRRLAPALLPAPPPSPRLSPHTRPRDPQRRAGLGTRRRRWGDGPRGREAVVPPPGVVDQRGATRRGRRGRGTERRTGASLSTGKRHAHTPAAYTRNLDSHSLDFPPPTCPCSALRTVTLLVHSPPRSTTSPLSSCATSFPSAPAPAPAPPATALPMALLAPLTLLAPSLTRLSSSTTRAAAPAAPVNAVAALRSAGGGRGENCARGEGAAGGEGEGGGGEGEGEGWEGAGAG